MFMIKTHFIIIIYIFDKFEQKHAFQLLVNRSSLIALFSITLKNTFVIDVNTFSRTALG